MRRHHRFQRYPFSSVQTNTIRMRFHFYPLSTAFSNRFFKSFTVNTQSVYERFSVNRRPKRIEMYAFTNVNVLV